MRLFRRFADARWWVHVLATLGAILVLVFVGNVIAAIFFIDFVDEHGPLGGDVPAQSALPLDEASALAQQFAPVLKLDSREPFAPISQAAYVGTTQLKEGEGKAITVLVARPSLEQLISEVGTCLRNRGCQYFLDVRDAEPDPPRHSQGRYAKIEDQLRRNGQRPTVYAHVTRYDDTGEYAIQYWFLYLFNFRLNEHESDWEQITLRLDENKQPVNVFYSAHTAGVPKPWSAIEKDGDHPVVYPALGSHANYFAAGRYPVKIFCKRLFPGITPCVRGRKVVVDVANGQGKTLTPADYTLASLEGPVFVGSYGSGNYVVLTRRPEVLADPRTRGVWADPLGQLR